MIDALPDGWAEELVDASVGWDEAVQFAQKRHQRRNAPRHPQGHGKPIYGLPGQVAPEPKAGE